MYMANEDHFLNENNKVKQLAVWRKCDTYHFPVVPPGGWDATVYMADEIHAWYGYNYVVTLQQWSRDPCW